MSRKKGFKIVVRLTEEENDQIVKAAKELNIRRRDYVKEKVFAEEGTPILGNNRKIVEKSKIADWYVNMVNTINLVEDKEIWKQLDTRMEELECIILN